MRKEGGRRKEGADECWRKETKRESLNQRHDGRIMASTVVRELMLVLNVCRS